MLEQRLGFGNLLVTLERECVRCVLIGSYAMAAYGADHGCQDVDLYYDRSEANMTALVSALAPLSPRLRSAPKDLPFVWDIRILKATSYLPLMTNYGDVDLFSSVVGVDTFESVWNRAAVITISNVPIRVPCLDDLVAMKRATGREWDNLTLEILFATRLLGERGRSTQ